MITDMDPDELECMICLDIVKEAINCDSCKKLFCLADVKGFRDACANCR